MEPNVALLTLTREGNAELLLVSGQVTMRTLVAAFAAQTQFNERDLYLIDLTKTVGELAQAGVSITLGAHELKFEGGGAALEAFEKQSLAERPSLIERMAVALPDTVAIPLPYIPKEKHPGPKFDSRTFRRQAKQRPPKVTPRSHLR